MELDRREKVRAAGAEREDAEAGARKQTLIAAPAAGEEAQARVTAEDGDRAAACAVRHKSALEFRKSSEEEFSSAPCVAGPYYTGSGVNADYCL